MSKGRNQYEKTNSIEIEFLLKVRKGLIKRKYSPAFSFVEILFINYFTPFILKNVTEPLIGSAMQKISGSSEFTQKYYDYKAYQKHFEDTFNSKHCEQYKVSKISKDDLFSYCLNELYQKTINSHEFISDNQFLETYGLTREKLLNIVARAAWFSKEHLGFISCDYDWFVAKDELSQYKTTIASLSEVSLGKLITFIGKMKEEVRRYEQDANIRVYLSRSHKQDNRYFPNQLSDYTSIFLLLPRGILPLVGTYLTRRSLKSYIVEPYLEPWIMNKLEQYENMVAKEPLWLTDSQSILAHKLKIHNEKLRREARIADKLTSSLNLLFWAWGIINAVWLAIEFMNKPNNFYSTVEAREADGLELFIKQLLLISSVGYVVNNLFKTGSDVSEVKNLEYLKAKLNYVMASVRKNEDCEYSRGVDIEDSLFLIPIDRYVNLDEEKVCLIVMKALKKHGCVIESTNIFNKNEPNKYMGIKLTKQFNPDALKKEIDQSLAKSVRIKTLYVQMEQLAKVIGASVLMVPKYQETTIVGKTIFSFLNNETAKFWADHLKKLPLFQSGAIKIKDHRLIFNVLPSDSSHFEKILEQGRKDKVKREEDFIREERERIQKLKLEESQQKEFDDKGKERANENVKIKKQKVKTHKSANEQKEHHKAASHNKPITSNNEVSQENDPSLSLIYNAPFWSKPHYIRFSLTINDFGGDKEAYQDCYELAKKGKLANGKRGHQGLALLGLFNKPIKDCTQKRTFIPKAKLKILGKRYGDIRLFAEKEKQIINNQECIVYNIKGIDMHAHK